MTVLKVMGISTATAAAMLTLGVAGAGAWWHGAATDLSARHATLCADMEAAFTDDALASLTGPQRAVIESARRHCRAHDHGAGRDRHR